MHAIFVIEVVSRNKFTIKAVTCLIGWSHVSHMSWRLANKIQQALIRFLQILHETLRHSAIQSNSFVIAGASTPPPYPLPLCLWCPQKCTGNDDLVCCKEKNLFKCTFDIKINSLLHDSAAIQSWKLPLNHRPADLSFCLHVCNYDIIQYLWGGYRTMTA